MVSFCLSVSQSIIYAKWSKEGNSPQDALQPKGRACRGPGAIIVFLVSTPLLTGGALRFPSVVPAGYLWGHTVGRIGVLIWVKMILFLFGGGITTLMQ